MNSERLESLCIFLSPLLPLFSLSPSYFFLSPSFSVSPSFSCSFFSISFFFLFPSLSRTHIALISSIPFHDNHESKLTIFTVIISSTKKPEGTSRRQHGTRRTISLSFQRLARETRRERAPSSFIAPLLFGFSSGLRWYAVPDP